MSGAVPLVPLVYQHNLDRDNFYVYYNLKSFCELPRCLSFPGIKTVLAHNWPSDLTGVSVENMNCDHNGDRQFAPGFKCVI
jgi:hypothetical protein